MKPSGILSALIPFDFTYNPQEIATPPDFYLPSIEATTEYEVFFNQLEATGSIAPCAFRIPGCQCHTTEPLGPGSAFGPSIPITAPVVAPSSERRTMAPRKMYRRGRNPYESEESESDDTEGSSECEEETEEPRIAGAKSDAGDEVESYYDDAGSVASGEEYFDSRRGTIPTKAKAARPNEPAKASSQHNRHPYTAHTQRPSQRAPTSSQTALPNTKPRKGDCVKCDQPNQWDNMIQCDNSERHGALTGWYHFSCADLNPYYSFKDGEKWLCETCTAAEDSSDDHVRQREISEDEGDFTYKGDKISSKRRKKTFSRLDGTSISGPLPNKGNHNRASKKTQHSPSESKASSNATFLPKAIDAGGRLKASPWREEEKDAIIKLLVEIMEEKPEGYRTEKRWEIVSERLLQRHDISRTWVMIKNFWNREGRARSGVDERRKPNGQRMVTGVQDPESRRRARKAQRAGVDANMATKSQGWKRNSREEEDDEAYNDKSLSARPRKRPSAPQPAVDQALEDVEQAPRRQIRENIENEDSSDEPSVTMHRKRLNEASSNEHIMPRPRKRASAPVPAVGQAPEDTEQAHRRQKARPREEPDQGSRRSVRETIENDNSSDDALVTRARDRGLAPSLALTEKPEYGFSAFERNDREIQNQILEDEALAKQLHCADWMRA